MYLTVDKESVIKKDKILGIFNLETINKTEEYKNIYEKLKNKNNIKDCESEKKKIRYN
jgi:hypothetical protein